MNDPGGTNCDVVIFLHAPGENRTGNNYLFRAVGDACLEHGFAAVRFDLPGCGESTAQFGAASWRDRVTEVIAAVEAWRPRASVHYVARGLSCGLLPERTGGLRIALSPTSASDVLPLLPASGAMLRPEPALSAEEEQLWTALGAEPHLVGGLRLRADDLRSLLLQVSPSRYDLAIVSSTANVSGSAFRMSTPDPLFRHESDRLALRGRIPGYLKEWRSWLPER